MKICIYQYHLQIKYQSSLLLHLFEIFHIIVYGRNGEGSGFIHDHVYDSGGHVNIGTQEVQNIKYGANNHEIF